ncbi:unnamed protein product [Hyaloperonospora brassicae]|uniref:Uncharacterized protein n=1 Tax=Hyaloperonospora brassicae TaxID=162125 RepID=A0AAV0UZH0_HYABA|nr:unnamed protein product [Hyaloperonospora brassicae]
MAATLVPAVPTSPTLKTTVHMTPNTDASAPAIVAGDEGAVVALEKSFSIVSVAGTPENTPPVKKRRRDESSHPTKKKKKKKKDTAQCVGYYVDALDKKMLWGEASIVQCNVATRKIKVHFVGWSKNHDLWTDVMSITAHGRYALRTKDNTVKSWNGDMRLFEGVLGIIEESTCPPVPRQIPDNHQVTLLSAGLARKTGDRAEVSRVDNTERPASRGKANVDFRNKVSSERTIVARKGVEKSNGPWHETARRLKRVKKVKSAEKSVQVPMQCVTKTKREGRQFTALTAEKACAPTQARVFFSNELPVFCNLELDDGTAMDFSVQREMARVEREALQSFLDECAVIWKKQVRALPAE